jgi:hypothetical protein
VEVSKQAVDAAKQAVSSSSVLVCPSMGMNDAERSVCPRLAPDGGMTLLDIGDVALFLLGDMISDLLLRRLSSTCKYLSPKHEQGLCLTDLLRYRTTVLREFTASVDVHFKRFLAEIEERRMFSLEHAGLLPLAQLMDENDVQCNLFLDLVESLTPADKCRLRQEFVVKVMIPISAGQKALQGYAGPDADAQNEPMLRLVLKGAYKEFPPTRGCQSLLVIHIMSLDHQQMFDAFLRAVFHCICPERITTVEGFGGPPRPMWTNAMADDSDIPIGLRNNTSVIFSGMVNPQPLLLPDVVRRMMWDARRCPFPVWHLEELNSLQDVWFRTAMVDPHRVRVIQLCGGAVRRVRNQEAIGLTGDD